MSKKTCCFTGHRKIPEEKIEDIRRYVRLEIIRLICEEGYLYFGAGGALGFDTLAAQSVLEVQKIFPEIKLILVLPCKNQADKWDAKDQWIYEDIKKKASKIVYVEEWYTNDCMLKRNRHLVDGSSACICYLTSNSGGTGYTVNYAESKGCPIFNMAEVSEEF